jgi:hypothetical protein
VQHDAPSAGQQATLRALHAVFRARKKALAWEMVCRKEMLAFNKSLILFFSTTREARALSIHEVRRSRVCLDGQSAWTDKS